MEGSDTDSATESGAAGPPTTKKLRTEIVHTKCVTTYANQSTDNESERLNNAPKPISKRYRKYRARKALLKQQTQNQQEPDAIVEIAAESSSSQENNVPGPSKRAKTAAQRMRQYREKKKRVRFRPHN